MKAPKVHAPGYTPGSARCDQMPGKPERLTTTDLSAVTCGICRRSVAAAARYKSLAEADSMAATSEAVR